MTYLFKTRKLSDGYTLTENIKTATNLEDAIERAKKMIPAEETRFGQLVEISIQTMWQDKTIEVARVNFAEARVYR